MYFDSFLRYNLKSRLVRYALKENTNLLANWVAYIIQLNDYWPLIRSTR